MSRAAATVEPVCLLALPGFAAGASVFEPLKTRIRSPLSLVAVDLPFSAVGAIAPARALTELAAECARSRSGPAVWIGWSLGGLVALRAAHLFPEQVTGVVTIGIGPRFVAAPDWPNALADADFARFEAQLRKDPDKALGRFFALQTHTRNGPSPALSRRLRQLALSDRHVAPAVLEQSLAILRRADLRTQAAALCCPLMTVLGEDDALVPSAVCEDLVRLNPDWRVEIIEAAGHAPFVSHPDDTLRLIESFAAAPGLSRGAA
ncbi:MAG: alpha/beta fold hydrolase [Gammaproteobacteria bacterium]|nr:alpha/beta fold hydrolase [Gammaproteobacteria bacterium]